jgi:hypothetical protein
MAFQVDVLDDAELLEFFGAEPVARVVEDGYWCYQVSDARGVELRFSFNLYEASVQTVVSLGNSQIASVSQEGAERMLLRDGKLRCEFFTSGMKTALTIEIGGELSIVWSSLRTK